MIRRRHRIRTEISARLTQALGAAADAIIDVDGKDLLRKAEAAEISPNHATKELLDQLLKEQT